MIFLICVFTILITIGAIASVFQLRANYRSRAFEKAKRNWFNSENMEKKWPWRSETEYLGGYETEFLLAEADYEGEQSSQAPSLEVVYESQASFPHLSKREIYRRLLIKNQGIARGNWLPLKVDEDWLIEDTKFYNAGEDELEIPAFLRRQTK